jgi:hypothetical protein
MFALGPDNQPLRGTRAIDTVAGGYTMIPQKFYHPNAARNALGLVGGNEMTVISGNLVDLESDLYNITRDLSKAPSRKYHPSCPLGSAADELQPANGLAAIHGGVCEPWPKQLVFTERATGKVRTIATDPRHLPTKQLFSYPGVPMPSPFVQQVHGAPWRF